MKLVPNLEAKLKAYEASSVRAVAKASMPAWPVYAAVAASTMAMSTSAEASIIYSGVQNVTAALPHPFTGPTDAAAATFFVGPAKFTVGVIQFISGGVFHNGVAEINGRQPDRLITSNGLAKRLASGAKISSGAGFGGYEGVLRHQSSTNARGNFAAGQTGLVGLQFNTGAGPDFGWARVLFHNSAGGYPTSITAIDWAYNTVPGQSIEAGQTVGSAVPEPSTWALMLLGTGATGVLAWRKRRQQMAANATAQAEAA